MKTGILLLNFGEPERPDLERVVLFLEAVFTANFELEHAADPEAGRQRAQMLAEVRAPALREDYRRIDGSPLKRQTEMQARALDVELRQRGCEAAISVGMQFTSPTIEEAVEELRDACADRLIGLPLYPLCGPSTTVCALAAMCRVVQDVGWDVEVTEITGWHRHLDYTRLRARAVRDLCEEEGLDLTDTGTRLVLSAHGTPLRYLQGGSRYDLYVHDHCKALAAELGVEQFALGYQNHENRPGVAWTQPDVREVLRNIHADRVIVVPVSFMQEQSETLVDLDDDLRETAVALGLNYFRVPVPYDDPKFVAVLADVIEAAGSSRRVCRCRPGAFCLNAQLEY